MGDYSRILVTSALPYANGAIHFGHLAGAYLPADIYVRHLRLLEKDVLYICGSDEHGVSILISAAKENVTPRDIIERYHEQNRKAFEGVGISFDNYSRTSLPVHHETAREWFSDFLKKGILNQKLEKQLYDAKADMFLPDRFVVGTCPHCGNENAYGDQCENCSKSYDQTELLNPRSQITGETPVVKDAVHWYFPLGDFQSRLSDYIESHAGDWKSNVLQQVRSWLKTGLTDRPITRDLEWGVSVPLDDAAGKVIYVWFEAVLGYISSTKEWSNREGKPERWKDYWCDPGTRYVAFIGKDNIVFHCIMFPAMLMARGNHILPDNVPANEFLNLEGRKFSKSQNWSIEINDFLEKYPPDPIRYTLALNMPESRDSDFYWRDFQARNNNELADILGNFINRTLHFTHRNYGGKIPEAGSLSDEDRKFFDGIASGAEAISLAYEKYRFRDGVMATMNIARLCNKYFNDQEPWKTLKSNPDRCAGTIHNSIQSIYALAILINPVLPFTSEKLRTILNLDKTIPWSWRSALEYRLPANHILGKSEILFEKIDDEKIEAEISALGRKDEGRTLEYPPIKDQIGIERFGDVDIRTGVILSAERIPKSEKLLKIQVDIGSDQRQVVAGIGKAYSPEDLIGTRVIVLVNLKPAKLFGVESQGMLLAATDGDGVPVLLRPGSDMLPGSIVS